ncbi:hypothetical protein [Nostoc sp.]
MAINPKSLRVGQSPRRSSVANDGNRPSGDARKLANATLTPLCQTLGRS